jgi:hypothetical protein
VAYATAAPLACIKYLTHAVHVVGAVGRRFRLSVLVKVSEFRESP